MDELELRHLRIIVAVADAGSLSKAATGLGMSQPALTAQLQRLERRVGGMLFARSFNGVAPTDLGAYVLASAHGLLADFDELMAGIRRLTQAVAVTGSIRVGGPPGLVVPLFVKSVAEHVGGGEPTIDIDTNPADLIRKVLDGKLDFAVLEEMPGFRTPLPPPLRSSLVLSAPMFVAVSENHRLADSADIDLRDIAEDNWVLPPVSEIAEQLALQRACAQAGFTATIKYQVSDSVTTRALVHQGAVTLAKPMAREGGGVVIRNLKGTPIVQEIMLVWHEDSPLAAVAERAPATLLAAYAQLVDTNPLFARWWAEHQGPPSAAGAERDPAL